MRKQKVAWRLVNGGGLIVSWKVDCDGLWYEQKIRVMGNDQGLTFEIPDGKETAWVFATWEELEACAVEELLAEV